jgi:hypothetical protein
VLADKAYAVAALRIPWGNRDSGTARSSVGAVAFALEGASSCEATRVARRCSIRAWRERWPERRRRRGAEGLPASAWAGAEASAVGMAGTGPGPVDCHGWSSCVVGDVHEVAVPRGQKVQAPEPDFESDWEGVRAAHGVPLGPVLSADHHRDGWWKADLQRSSPTWRANCRCGK